MVGKEPHERHILGSWKQGPLPPQQGPAALREGLEALASPLGIVSLGGRLAAARAGNASLGSVPKGDALPLLGYVPPLLPADLGDPAFRRTHGLEKAYIAGEMANGIASVELVEAMGRAGMLGFFGAAGLPPPVVEEAILRLQKSLGSLPHGFNLIHSPADTALEAGCTDLYLRHGVRLVGASAYLDLTSHVVRYRVHGIRRLPDGTVEAPNRIIAKVSRAEVARKFLSPPPEALLRELVSRNEITEEQARMAETLPMAEDVTAEADSGGHTDNRPLVVILPVIQAIRDELQEKHRYAVTPRIGAGGGIATPAAAAAAFALGAAYVVTGSVNQGCREAGTSDAVRQMLAGASSTDVAMAPAADMFEMGVKVQVLSRGTLFPVRAGKLYDLYRELDSVEALPANVRAELEEKYFRCSLEEAWEGCRSFFNDRDPAQIRRAEKEPKHKLALLFRSYLGRSSGWANTGAPDRRLDYQVWCGPAMGAFNEWAKGSFLEDWQHRHVVSVADNLMTGAAYLTRLSALRSQGLSLPPGLETFRPADESALQAMTAAASLRNADADAEAAAGDDEFRAVDESRDAIAIVGMSGLFPSAGDLTAFWASLRSGTDAVGEIPAGYWSVDDYHDPDPKAPDKTYAKRGAFLDPVDFDPTEFGIPPTILEATDTSQLLGLVAARMAMEDAGYGEGVEWNKDRASVLLGVTGTQELVISLGSRLGHPHWRRALAEAGVPAEQAEEVVERIGRSYVGWQENSFPGLLGNVVAGRIANRFDFGGTNAVVDAACASSLGAIHLACMELQTGKADLVLTGGVDTLNDIFMHMCFSKTPALSPTGDARPFSSKADGTILGEGVGMLVLKRLSDAEADGDRIHAVIRAIGTSSDGRAKSIYAPLPEGQAKSLEAAYREAGITARDIDLVEAHGTGTKAGDASEFAALRKVYGDASDDTNWCALGSVKSQIGHAKAAAGSAGMIKAALALSHKVIPPTLKVDAPNPDLSIDSSPFYLPTESLPWIAGDRKRRAAVSAFGFGGSNFHAVVEEYRSSRQAPAWDGATELVALSAMDEAGLLAALDGLAATAEFKTFAASSRARFRPADALRLVIVMDPGADRLRKVEQARALIQKGPGQIDGVHFGRGEAGKLAFVFPGQGSQSVGMLRDLACVFPEMLASLEEAGGVARSIFPTPGFDPEARKAQQAALTATDVAQPALGTVEKGALEILRRFGLRPQLTAGHSYGELVALHAAGRIDAEALKTLSSLRGRLMAGDGSDRGTMMAMHTDLSAIEEMIAADGLDVVLANRNGPAQGVLSGSRAAIDEAERSCRKRGVRATRLVVGAAFHSALVAEAAIGLREGLAGLEFSPGSIPVIANATAEPYPADADAARDRLAGQLATPVRFVEVVERLWADGARTFVEVGPKAVLTGLIRGILGEKEHRAIALDASQGRRDGLVDLAQVLARVAADGHPVELTEWQRLQPPPRSEFHKPRMKRMSIPLIGANHRDPPKGEVRRRTPPVGNRNMVTTNGKTSGAGGNGEHAAPRLAQQMHVSGAVSLYPSGASAAQPNVAVELSMSQKNGTDTHSYAPPAVTSPTGSLLLEALRVNGDTLRALQMLQEQTAQIHQRFLEGQVVAQQSFQSILHGQQRLVEQAMGMAPTMPMAPMQPAPWQAAMQQAPMAPMAAAPQGHWAGQAPMHPGAFSPQQGGGAPQQQAQPFTQAANHGSGGFAQQQAQPFAQEANHGGFAQQQAQPFTPAANHGSGGSAQQQAQPIAQAAAQAVNVAHAPAAPEPSQTIDVVAEMLAVVAEATGYPTEMLELEMDLEADLGIDSIKRVEILSLLSKRIPNAPAVDPEHLGSLRTLGQVAAFVGGTSTSAGSPAAPASHPASGGLPAVAAPAASAPQAFHAPAAAPAASPAAPAILDSGDALSTLLAVVAELTGYPTEMLSLEMDLEADLGIDSIKRVEILSLLSKRLPNAPSVDPERLGGLRTLQQVLDFAAPGHGRAAGGGGGSAAAAASPKEGSSEPQLRGSSHCPVTSAEVGAAQRLERREVVPVRLAAPANAAPWKLAAGVLEITDDGDGLAEALISALASRGVEARKTSLGDGPAADATGLVILAGASFTDEDQAKAFAKIRAAAPSLHEAAANGGALLATVSRKDGAFARLDPLSGPTSHGGLAGLAKTAASEWQDVLCRAFDVASSWSPAEAADALAEELATKGPREMGLGPAGRLGLSLAPRPLPPATDRVRQGDLVVVTGGARGVTAACAIELAKAARPTLLLLGRSPLPGEEPAWLHGADDEASIKRALLAHGFPGGKPTPRELGAASREILANREVRATLSALSAAGAIGIYRSVDARDREALAEVIAEAREVHGPVRGVIHGAGVLRDKRIEEKSDEDFAAVFSTKVDGLHALLEATAADDLTFLALFTSVSGRFGRRGQADYAAANETLTAMALREARRRPNCRVVALDWGPWAGGMVTPALAREFEKEGVGLIPIDAGAQLLAREAMAAPGGGVEWVVGAGFPSSEEPAPVDFQLVATKRPDPAVHLYLDDHRLAGKAVLPVAMSVEWLAEAALAAHPGLELAAVESLRLLQGVVIDRAVPQLCLWAGPPRHLEGGRIAVPMELRNAADRVQVKATVLLGEQDPAPRAGDLPAGLLPFGRDAASIYANRELFHGSRFHALEDLESVGPGGVVARLRAEASPADWFATAPDGSAESHDAPPAAFATSPLALDGIFQAMVIACRELHGAPSLPSRFEALRFYGELPESVRAVATIRETDGATMISDCDLIGADGVVLARLEGYACTISPSLEAAYRGDLE